MPWSFSWPSSLVSTLRGLPLWWPFPNLHLQLQLKLPSASRLSSLYVFTSTSNMCKIIPQFVPWNNFSAWLPNTFSVTECRKLWATFYIYSSLTHHSFRIRGQPQDATWRNLATVLIVVDTADSWLCNYMMKCFWKIILASILPHLITSAQVIITSTSIIYLFYNYLYNVYYVPGTILGILQILTF